MTKMGRPPLPEGERKAITFRIRMTESERQQIDRAAESENGSSSEWARNVLLRAARRRLTH
jgi:uncharacterized protein (DUF1778 family)